MTDVLEKSVTANDQEFYRQTRGAYFLTVPNVPYAGQLVLPPNPPAWWSPARDHALRATLFAEDMWASAVAKAITAQAALGWTVTDSADSQQRVKRQQDQYLYANGGQGWVVFLQMYLQDVLTTDNGGAFEIVRATSAAGSRILGRVHLDSGRVRRTGDAEIPAIYMDLKGYEHEMRAHQISLYADMPSAAAAAFGVGNCAAGRVYRTIYKLAAMEQYAVEKITGRGVKSIEIVNGIAPHQLEDAIATARSQRAAEGFQQYMGSLILTSVVKDSAASGYRIDLAGLPDGFNAKEERDNGYVKYANALGVSVTQIQPLSGQGLGNAGQSQVLDDQAETAGALIAWRKWWEQNENTHLTPATTMFSWTVNDLREQKAEAEVQKLRADTRTVMITAGEISPEIARQMAVDSGDLSAEIVADETPGGSVTDDTKVVPANQPLALPLPTAPPAPATKEGWGEMVYDQWGPLPNFPEPGTDRAEGWRRFMLTGKADEPDPTPLPLRRLLGRLRRAVEAMTDNLEAGDISADQWRDSMADALTTAYPTAYKTGAGAPADPAATKRLADQVAAQLKYLDNFTVEIKDGAEWQAGWNSRAAMYAEGIKVPYWQGATKVLPLPAMPAEGTQCLTRCRCVWDVQQLDGDGNYDATWKMSASESCQTCRQRAAEWAPLKIRNGRLV